MAKKKTSTSLDEGLYFACMGICKQTNLRMNDIIELGIIELITKFDEDLTLEGIDLKRYALDMKYRKLRRFVSLSRTELVSRELAPMKIYIDLFKLLKIGTNNKLAIEAYLDLRLKEADHYKENNGLKKLLLDLQKRVNENYDNLHVHVSQYFENVKYIKVIEKKVKQLEEKIKEGED